MPGLHSLSLGLLAASTLVYASPAADALVTQAPVVTRVPEHTEYCIRTASCPNILCPRGQSTFYVTTSWWCDCGGCRTPTPTPTPTATSTVTWSIPASLTSPPPPLTRACNFLSPCPPIPVYPGDFGAILTSLEGAGTCRFAGCAVGPTAGQTFPTPKPSGTVVCTDTGAYDTLCPWDSTLVKTWRTYWTTNVQCVPAGCYPTATAMATAAP